MGRWVTCVQDTCPLTLNFFLLEQEELEKAWKHFSHSLNCCFSQVQVLKTLMINIVLCSVAYQWDAGVYFLGFPQGWA